MSGGFHDFLWPSGDARSNYLCWTDLRDRLCDRRRISPLEQRPLHPPMNRILDLLKDLIKAGMRHTPYRITRNWGANRFQAIEEALIALRKRGFEPRVIIDGGANDGSFARKLSKIFKTARFELFEPQPACHDALSDLAQLPRFNFHPVALGAATGSLSLRIDPGRITGGAHVTPSQPGNSDSSVINISVCSLDSMFSDRIRKEDRTLMKLDLQGWELEALKGAERALEGVEVVLTEVSFFAQAYEPPIEKLVRFLDEKGFSLYDIAAIAARRRDNRPHQGDFIFVSRDSTLMLDTRWG